MSKHKPLGSDNSQQRKGENRGANFAENISYAIGRCLLGWMITAESGRGLCMIGFGDFAEELPPLLKQYFPKAQLLRADQEHAGLVKAVAGLIEEPGGTFPVPLDIQGTAFQQKVWECLRQIAPGETRSYSDIAAQLGNPQAVRAVAGACAANRLAVVIPCHRVLAKDGGLSGYRWGIERKKQLLENEKKKSSPTRQA